MICGLCTFDAAFYGERLHLFEGEPCCVGCFETLHGVNINAGQRDDLIRAQWRALPLVTTTPADPSLPLH